MSDLHEAIRTGTAAEIRVASFEAAEAIDSSRAFHELADAIVAARPKPEDVVSGTVGGFAMGGFLPINCGSHPFNPGDHVTITREAQ